ncbi:MAG: 3-oxoacyl-[acyl-carrier-protein] synthase 2 [Candidatus Desulfovibrio kirbyi]|uniref:3-oxoacyl-[acyl-carrier-protein] synthase 2 n=1 Tax=Candidatus Desulfovibrio kirbyi TaxID=2696086 RepID=A0A6L2R4V4_9BACT|nr:MAG: 3-oxoacyl-[acyl-carrier-protein] synthase 2 [Candidatus Desulfovibrio kirbyi]
MVRPRVVVTGVSGLTPLANNMESSWKKLLAGESGIAPLTLFDASAYDSRIAGEVKGFVPEDFMTSKQARHMDRFTQFAVAAGSMLMRDANFSITQDNAFDVAVILGVGMGGLCTIETWHTKLLESGPSRISPFMIPMLISNMGPAQVSIFTGIKGPNLVTTSACASAIHAIGTAYSEILLGRVTCAVSGGVESTVTPLAMGGFTALKALATHYNDAPAKASRPFDALREGFVLGEGAGFMFLENLENAKARSAKIYAEVVGYGASCDAYHMTAPRVDGEGMARSMHNALREAGIPPAAVGHINAHATSTRLNDATETKAIKQIFGNHAGNIKISATKSMTGHLLGAAGGIEAVFTALALREEMLPGTINLENPDPECDLDYMADGSERIACEYGMCNSFGFGGTNASLILKKWNE